MENSEFLVFWRREPSPDAMGPVCGRPVSAWAAAFRVQLANSQNPGYFAIFPKNPGFGVPPFKAVPPYFRGLYLRAQRESDNVPDM